MAFEGLSQGRIYSHRSDRERIGGGPYGAKTPKLSSSSHRQILLAFFPRGSRFTTVWARQQVILNLTPPNKRKGECVAKADGPIRGHTFRDCVADGRYSIYFGTLY